MPGPLERECRHPAAWQVTNLRASKGICRHCLASWHQHLACWSWFMSAFPLLALWTGMMTELLPQVSSPPCKSYISLHLQCRMNGCFLLPWAGGIVLLLTLDPMWMCRVGVRGSVEGCLSVEKGLCALVPVLAPRKFCPGAGLVSRGALLQCARAWAPPPTLGMVQCFFCSSLQNRLIWLFTNLCQMPDFFHHENCIAKSKRKKKKSNILTSLNQRALSFFFFFLI